MKPGQKPTILVIEDDPLNLELATDLLEAGNFIVFPAKTGEDGILIAREIQPSLVLMDLGLPGMDGLAATRALRAEPATSALTIVALTSHAMMGDENLALAAGCDGYLTKPIDTRTFARKIAEFIELAPQLRPAKPVSP